MFTGIIEEKSQVTLCEEKDQSLKILVERPSSFDDLKIGDSVACNGVCLTVEEFDQDKMQFTIGYETLQVTGWQASDLLHQKINMERSLRFGDRIHGHMVSGHVDSLSKVVVKKWEGDCLIFQFSLHDRQRPLLWEKSSVAVNGVSLTVNSVGLEFFEVCLIPETLRKTNLDQLEEGHNVNIETDYYMKGLLNSRGGANA